MAPQTSLEQMISGDMGSAMFSSYYDEAALTLPVLRIMRTMVQYWLKDVALFENAFADLQIIHFYRWLQSPNSLLYDPAIRRTLQSYMKKLCILVWDIFLYQKTAALIERKKFFDDLSVETILKKLMIWYLLYLGFPDTGK